MTSHGLVLILFLCYAARLYIISTFLCYRKYVGFKPWRHTRSGAEPKTETLGIALIVLKGLSRVPHTLKKFQSLNLCYLGLDHRKSILSFSDLHLKEICGR